ncbi:MAG: PilN domain-containing protein [Candidatus Saccharimonadales bacterium]
MVNFNLLPDVKMQFLKTKRLEYLAVTVSIIVGAVSLLVFILLFVYVDVAQKVKLNNLTNQISSYSDKLGSNKSLNQILTIQNQLQTIPSLENQSPSVSRLFGYLTQLVPVNITISSLDLNYATNNINITGGADSLDTVNTFVDTLKYATYTDNTTNVKNSPAFSSVVLSSFSYNTANAGSGSPAAQYGISFNFNPDIFNSADSVTLTVPSETTTRSILNQPDLFKANPK